MELVNTSWGWQNKLLIAILLLASVCIVTVSVIDISKKFWRFIVSPKANFKSASNTFVIISLLTMIFASISIFAAIAHFADVKKHTMYFEYSKVLTVEKKTEPKGFSVIMVDEHGEKYQYSLNWCHNHTDFEVGTKHNILIKEKIYIKNSDGHNEVEKTKSYKVICK